MEKKASAKLDGTKAAVKAAETKAAAKVEETKAAVKETVAEKKEAAETKVAAKAAEAKAAVKETAEEKAKETKKVVKEKKTAKVTKKAEKEELKPEVVIQYQGREAIVAEAIEKAKSQFVAEGHRVSSIKSLQIYLKPEEFAAYYVINQKFAGRVDLF